MFASHPLKFFNIRVVLTEEQLLHELLERRLADKKQEFNNFGETEPGSAPKEP
jgi:hypothetical protein